jgi:hypothetical protein
MAMYKYFVTTVTNQNYFTKELKNRLNSGNTWLSFSLESLSFSLFSKELEIKIYETNFICCVKHGLSV